MKKAQNQLQPVAHNVRELLAYNDMAFIDCAYKTLLNRSPDPGGFQTYLRRIRAGEAKMCLLLNISFSREGRIENAISLPGLPIACLKYLLARNWVTGWWFRPIAQVEGESPIERRLRCIENMLMRFEQDRQREASELDSAADDVAGLLAALTEKPLA